MGDKKVVKRLYYLKEKMLGIQTREENDEQKIKALELAKEKKACGGDGC